jgi:hypothetical protein
MAEKIKMASVSTIFVSFGSHTVFSQPIFKRKLGLNLKISWEITVWEPKEKNGGRWRHLDLIRHFEVKIKKTILGYFFKDFLSKSQVSINLHKDWLRYGKFMLGGHLDFVRCFVCFCFDFFNDLNYHNTSLDQL